MMETVSSCHRLRAFFAGIDIDENDRCARCQRLVKEHTDEPCRIGESRLKSSGFFYCPRCGRTVNEHSSGPDISSEDAMAIEQMRVQIKQIAEAPTRTAVEVVRGIWCDLLSRKIDMDGVDEATRIEILCAWYRHVAKVLGAPLVNLPADLLELVR